MIDLPAQEPATMEVQKMDQKQNLIQKIRSMCEATKDIREDIPVSLTMRAYFLDLCNATNANEIFSYKAAHFVLDGCRDGLEWGYMQDRGINPSFLQYHIDTDEIFNLKHLIKDTGKGTEGIYDMPAADCESRIFGAIYTIMKDFPDFNPKFTTFIFGGTMEDMPPLRDKDGNPNMEFFRAWKQKTEAFYRNNK